MHNTITIQSISYVFFLLMLTAIITNKEKKKNPEFRTLNPIQNSS